MRAARSIEVAATPRSTRAPASSAVARSPTIMESSSVLPTAYSATSTRLYASTSSPATTVSSTAPARTAGSSSSTKRAPTGP